MFLLYTAFFSWRHLFSEMFCASLITNLKGNRLNIQRDTTEIKLSSLCIAGITNFQWTAPQVFIPLQAKALSCLTSTLTLLLYFSSSEGEWSCCLPHHQIWWYCFQWIMPCFEALWAPWILKHCTKHHLGITESILYNCLVPSENTRSTVVQNSWHFLTSCPPNICLCETLLNTPLIH